MTFLPIVERELRVAARRRGTYWTRLGLAFLASCIGAGIIALTSESQPPTQVGRFVFYGLSGLVMIYCLSYGRYATADCLSVEKREGTLGLLFLTDLKGLDIVLGKLAATSIGGLYALLGMLPLLSFCLLLGGVTVGEYWRMVLVLLDSFLLSLAVGLVSSALTREFRYAMATNFLVLLLFVVVIPVGSATVCIAIAGGTWYGFFNSSPIYAYVLSFDAYYTGRMAEFWETLGLNLGLSCLLILLASRLVLHSRREKVLRPRGARWRERWRAWSFGAAEARPAFRKRLLDRNAFYWLAARARLKPLHVWVFLASVAAYWIAGRVLEGELWMDPSVSIAVAAMVNFALKSWIVIEAGHELADDQKSGALELLLSVPLTVGDIVRGQVLALRRQFLKPVIMVIAMGLVLMGLLYYHSPAPAIFVIGSAAIFMFVLDTFALVGVAMLRALTARNHNAATISTMMRLLVLPWIVFGLVVAAGHLYFSLAPPYRWSPGWRFYLWLWFGLGVAADLIFGLTAWWRLLSKFRQIALRRFDPAPPRFLRILNRAGGPASGTSPAATATSRVFEKPPRQRRRIPTWAFGAIALVLTGYIMTRAFRASDSPPLVVPMSSRRVPLQVFPGQDGAFIILPDQSLWRWGRTDGGLSARAGVPRQVGTNCDWLQAASDSTHCVGLRADGSIWEWGSRGPHQGSEPQPTGLGSNWVKVTVVPMGAAAGLRQDGSLWEWGHGRPGYAFGTSDWAQNDLFQVGTNQDWTNIFCCQFGSYGLRQDGSLWTWGMGAGAVRYGGPRHAVPVVGSGSVQNGTTNSGPIVTQQFFELTYSPRGGRSLDPLRVGSNTNWLGFTGGVGPMAWTTSGELWDLLRNVGSSAAPGSVLAGPVLSNSALGRAAYAFTGSPQLFMLHPDGTLWTSHYPVGARARAAPVAGHWRRVGKRADWVSLWGGGGTAFGLTADGTLWTWGTDWGRDQATTFASRLSAIKFRLQILFGASRSNPIIAYFPAVKEPRPLLRIVWDNAGRPNLALPR